MTKMKSVPKAMHLLATMVLVLAGISSDASAQIPKAMEPYVAPSGQALLVFSRLRRRQANSYPLLRLRRLKANSYPLSLR